MSRKRVARVTANSGSRAADYGKVNVELEGGNGMKSIEQYVVSADRCDATSGGWRFGVDPAADGAAPATVILCPGNVQQADDRRECEGEHRAGLRDEHEPARRHQVSVTSRLAVAVETAREREDHDRPPSARQLAALSIPTVWRLASVWFVNRGLSLRQPSPYARTPASCGAVPRTR